ncbi:MAG: YraN family protein [Candidatus Pacebacteria bacterium]|nr:YraN family protein [Candidatus Paceibacterota bacterium]
MANPLQKFSKSRQKGNLGEDLASLFLMKQGFEILERNYLKPWGEIDIVAKKNKTLHFVEIKSVSCEIEQNNVSRETVTHETIRPEENMHENKLECLKRVIQTYLTDKRISRETPFQLDLITVRIDRNSKTALVESFDNVVI